MDKSLIYSDLNLLKVLHALLEERNVTHAAARLFVSQPAMSKSLSRLRQLFGDALFVRSPNGLIATPKAESLVIPVKRAIEELGDLLKPSAFDPQKASGFLRIAAPEPFVIGTIANLAIRLQKLAPNMVVEVVHLMDDHLSLLTAGKIDFVIYLDQPYPEGFKKQPILTAAPRIWFRKGHPLNKKKNVELSDTCSYPQIACHSPNVTAADIQLVEVEMAKQGLQRKVVMHTSHMLIALDVLTQSDAVMLGPDFLSALPGIGKDIASRSLANIPAFKHLKIKLSLVQHERTVNSPLHSWIAAEIADIFQLASQTPHAEPSLPSQKKPARRKPPPKKAAAR